MRARQPSFQNKNQKKNTKAFMPLNLVLGLHILPANPKSGFASFAISLVILHKTAGATQRPSSLPPLLCKIELGKIHKDIFFNCLELGEELGVI